MIFLPYPDDGADYSVRHAGKPELPSQIKVLVENAKSIEEANLYLLLPSSA